MDEKLCRVIRDPRVTHRKEEGRDNRPDVGTQQFEASCTEEGVITF